MNNLDITKEEMESLGVLLRSPNLISKQISMKKLAQLAYDHCELTGCPLETKLVIDSKKLYKLLKHFDRITEDAGIMDNIVYANLHYDPANNHTSSINTSSKILLEFHFDPQGGN